MSPHLLRQAARLLRAGGLVLLPTEGVWGISCDPLNPRAVMRLLRAKQRPMHKGLILASDRPEWLQPFIADSEWGRQALANAESDWPGPTTWVCPAAEAAPFWLTGGHPGIALRVTDHPLLAALSAAFGGPLVTTSANITGHPAALRGWQARKQLGRHADGLLAGELQRPGQPSRIQSALDNSILRA